MKKSIVEAVQYIKFNVKNLAIKFYVHHSTKKGFLLTQRVMSMCAIAFGLLTIYLTSVSMENKDASFGVFLVAMGMYGLFTKNKMGGKNE